MKSRLRRHYETTCAWAESRSRANRTINLIFMALRPGTGYAAIYNAELKDGRFPPAHAGRRIRMLAVYQNGFLVGAPRPESPKTAKAAKTAKPPKAAKTAKGRRRIPMT